MNFYLQCSAALIWIKFCGAGLKTGKPWVMNVQQGRGHVAQAFRKTSPNVYSI